MNGREKFLEVIEGISAECDLLYVPAPDDTSLVDRSPKNRGAASLKNGAALIAAGLIDGGAAIELDGSNDYIDTGYNPFVNGKALTFAGLARSDGAAGGDTLFGGSGTSSVHPYLRVDSTTQVTFDMNASGGAAAVTWPGAWPAGANFWALVVDEPGDTVELFINGESKGVKAITEAYPGSPGNLKIGARGLEGDPFDGPVLPFAVFLGALTAADIAALSAAILYTAARREVLILNPKEVATEGRAEINLHFDATQVRESGPDWGQFEPDMFMAEKDYGSIPIDDRLPNRIISIPLVLGATGDFDAARIALQAEVTRIKDEGGWFKRECIGGTYGEAGSRLYADIVKASFKLGGGTLAASHGVDADAELILEVLPDWYGDEETGELHEGTGDLSWTEQIKGELPGRVTALTVTDKSGNNQMGLGYHFRCRNYSAEESAAWALEAEDLLPLDSAAIATLSEASPAGSTVNNVVTHKSLGTTWTNILALGRRPKVRSVGTAASGTGAIAPPLPEFKENDILVMFIETANEGIGVPAGWGVVNGTPIGVATGTVTRLTVLWKRAGASEEAPTLPDPGDHQIARIMAVSGCIQTGNPWDVVSGGTELVSDTSVEIPGTTTTVDGCLVIAAVATGTDVSSSSHASGWTNASLQALAERMDSWTAEGSGGGFAVATGLKAQAGAYDATTATIGTANFKALFSLALKPEAGGNFLSHSGLYDVWARAYTTSGDPPWLRLLYDVGDLVAPAENPGVKIPGTTNAFLVPLGQADLRRGLFSDHRWGGLIQGRGTSGGENVTIDTLFFFNGDEASGIITGLLKPNVGLSGIRARDEFNQAKGALNGKALPDGSGNWVTSGSAKGDFEVGSGVITRTAEVDSEYRMAKSPLSGGPYNVLAMQVTVTWTEIPAASETTLTSGLFYNAASSAIVLDSRLVGSKRVTSLDFIGSSKIPFTVEPDQAYTLTLLYSGLGLTIAYVNGLEVGRGLIGGGPSGLSNCWIGDLNFTSGKITRTYDDFAVWVPDVDPVIFANRSAWLTSQGIFRGDSLGIGSGAVARPIADLPRIPVSGPDKRPVEIAVRTSRGDYGDLCDVKPAATSAQLSYRPCWPDVPAGP